MDRASSAYQDFLFGAKMFANFELLPAATARYEQLAGAAGEPPRTPEQAGQLMEHELAYQTFAWFEHHAQRMKYDGPRGLVQYVRGHPMEFEPAFQQPPGHQLGALELNPSLELPDYYRRTDFHLQPGGIWPDNLAACIYEQVALTTFPGLNEKQQIHTLFTEHLPARTYRRILDVGCGYAKSATPFADRFPEAEVFGIDVSAAVLKLGHHKAEASGRRLMLSQQNGEHTDFASEMFDLVTATMVIHEIPPAPLQRLFRETYRLLSAGGQAVFLDFYRTGDAWRDFIMDGHSQRNNEPFMKMLFRLDLEHMAHEAGFESAEVVPFDERSGCVRQGMRPEWHFPWATVVLQK